MERRGFFGKILGGIGAFALGAGAKRMEGGLDPAARSPRVEVSHWTFVNATPPPTIVVERGQLGNYLTVDGKEMQYVRRSPRDHGTLYAGNLVYWEDDGNAYEVTGYSFRGRDTLAGIVVTDCRPGDYIWIQRSGRGQVAATQLFYKGSPIIEDQYTPKRAFYIVPKMNEDRD